MSSRGLTGSGSNIGPPPEAVTPMRHHDDGAALEKEVTLLELLDRVLDKGVVLSGDITLSVADVDLVYVGLRVLLSSVDAAERRRAGGAAGGGSEQTGRPAE